ncbi:hypothetical protein JW877_10115 [bacterium]|nr:hypothetical protein [bacterium]
MALLWLLKFGLALAVVLLLSLIAERVSPRLAGLLSGFPTGSALTLFFYGLELGPRFAAQSAVYNLTGLLAMQTLFFIYYLVSMKLKKNNILLLSVFAITGWFIVIFILHFFKMNRCTALLVSIAGIFLYSFLFRNISEVKISRPIRLGVFTLFIRALFSAAVILLITGVARMVDARWAGLFSSFPLTAFPLVLIIHFSYGKTEVHALIKNIPPGMGSLVFYSLTVSWAYVNWGIFWGTLASFIAAGLYLGLYLGLTRRKLAPG